MKKPVSERAMTARINRKLAKEGSRKLHKTRAGQVDVLGAYHIVDEEKGEVVEHHIDGLETVAEAVGVMKPFEEVVYDQ